MTRRVMRAMAWAPTATRNPALRMAGWPISRENRRPVRRKASKRSPTTRSYRSGAETGSLTNRSAAMMPDSSP